MQFFAQYAQNKKKPKVWSRFAHPQLFLTFAGMGSLEMSSSSMNMSSQQEKQASMQSAQSQMMSQQAKKMSVVQTEQTEELADQEIFVPLRHVNQMQKNALAEATAMAKMKDDHFELVVNIQKFTPEEVKVYVEGQAVLVQARKTTSEGFISASYENKFNLPEDVDVGRLTSGISRDGILMIRVPRRTPERIIPIQFDARISAVKKALQQTVQHVETEMTAEEVQQDLLKENIAPMEIEKEEDAVKAASAEVVEGESESF